MSRTLTVREMALQAHKKAQEAHEAKVREQRAERERREHEAAQAAVLEVATHSPLAEWFPNVKWAWHGPMRDGCVVAPLNEPELRFAVTRQTPEGSEPRAYMIRLVPAYVKDPTAARANLVTVRSLEDVGEVLADWSSPRPESACEEAS